MTDHEAAALKAVADVLENDNWSGSSDELAVAVLDAARPHLAAAERECMLETAENLVGLEAGALQTAQARITELEQLARDMLGRFHKRANVGGLCSSTGWIPDAQVARWRAALDGEPAAQEVRPQRIVICGCTQVPELGPCPHNRQAAP